MTLTLEDFFSSQAAFNEKLYGIGEHSSVSQDILLREMLLSLHNEVSQLASFLDLKNLPRNKAKASSSESSAHNKLLYESVDVIRYVIAILNLQGITAEDFVEAYISKDIYLHCEYLQKKERKTEGVIVCDIDDVLNTFREDFQKFLSIEFGINLVEDFSYYSTSQLKSFGVHPDDVFSQFIESGGLRYLSPVDKMIGLLDSLYDKYTIILLTSRPEQNLKCKFDTYYWLNKHGVCYDSINFSGEKYLWTTQNINSELPLVLAIDDSAKHIAEYCSHGVLTLAPKRPYNDFLSYENLIFYDVVEQLRERLTTIGVL